MLVLELRLRFKASPIVHNIEIDAFCGHGDGEAGVRKIFGNIVQPGEVVLADIQKVANNHLPVVAQAVGTVIVQAYAAFTRYQKGVLGSGGNKRLGGQMKWVPDLAIVKVRMKNL